MTKFGLVTHMGRAVFLEVSHAIAFAEMGRAVRQRQLSVLFLFVPRCWLSERKSIRPRKEVNVDVLLQW